MATVVAWIQAYDAEYTLRRTMEGMCDGHF